MTTWRRQTIKGSMGSMLQRLAAGLVAPLLVFGGLAGTGAVCPARLGIEVAEPCPCDHQAPPVEGSRLGTPCCCDEMGQAPASSVPVSAVERVQGPPAPVLLVVEGPLLAVADGEPRQVPPDRPAGAGPPVLRQTSILLI